MRAAEEGLTIVVRDHGFGIQPRAGAVRPRRSASACR